MSCWVNSTLRDRIPCGRGRGAKVEFWPWGGVAKRSKLGEPGFSGQTSPGGVRRGSREARGGLYVVRGLLAGAVRPDREWDPEPPAQQEGPSPRPFWAGVVEPVKLGQAREA